MNAATRVNDLIVIGGRLAELMKEENASLRARRAKDVAGFLEDKTALSHAFESRFKGLADKPDELAGIDVEQGERLRGMAKKVQILMEENDHLLKVALAAHETVVESIAEAVKSSQPGPSIYTRGGQRGSASDHGAKTRPISLDQAL